MLWFGHHVACSFASRVRVLKGLSASTALLVGATATSLAVCGVPNSARAASSPRLAQSEQASPASPFAAQHPAAIPAPATAEVNGFRSARFGMTEAEVRAAIKTDFPGNDRKVEESRNAVEQTNILSLDVPALLPNGGAAKISYVFGYRSKKLIEISVLWSKATDEKNTPKQLLADGEILRANFLEEGFKKDSIAVDKSVPGGVLLFRGVDANDHTTVLLLPGANAHHKEGEAFTPASLLLLYIADAKHPDIFKIRHGQF